MIASGGLDKTIKIWKVSDGSLIRTLNGHPEGITCLCFSPDGESIASGSSDKTIKIWSISDGSLIHTLRWHGAFISSLCFSPDGQMIASGSGDHSIILWRVSDGDLIKRLTNAGHGGWGIYLSFSPDGQMIASGSENNTLALWRVSDDSYLRLISGHSRGIIDVSFSPDGQIIASAGSDDESIRLWRVVNGSLIQKIDVGGNDSNVLFSPDGQIIASRSWDNYDGIKFWRVSDGSLIRTIQGFSNCISLSPDGQIIASGSINNTILLWRVSDGSLIRTIQGNAVTISFSPDGQIIASAGSDDESIKLWRVSDGSLIQKIDVGDNASNVIFSPDGQIIASRIADRYNGIRLWRVSDGSLIRTIQGGSHCISFSPDGQIIASGSDNNTIQLWRVSDGSLIHTLKGHTGWVKRVCFSPDGQTIASGSSDKTVRLWSVEGTPLQSDVSDAVFSIVAPELNTKEIDMKQCLVAAVKDSLVTDFIINSGTYKCRVDSIYFTGADANAFSLVSGIPVYTIEAGKNKATEFRFKPTEARKYEAHIVIITQADTLRQTIKGEGVQPMLKVMNNLIDFGKVRVGTPRDSTQAVTIKNIGSSPLTITGTNHAAPDAVSFSTVSGGGIFTIPVGETHKMDLRFIASSTDRTNGILQFHYNGTGSPAEILLYGQGVLPEIKVVNSELDFGRILLGRDTTLLQAVTIANIGNGELKISDIKITNPAFTRISGSMNNVLLAGDTLKFDFTFTPTKLDMDYADLEIYHEEANSPTIVKMKGEAYTIASNASAILQAGNISAYSGDIIELPIILKNQEHLSEANISKIKVDLFFNPTLLYPLDYPLQAINNQIAKITLDNLPANKAIGEALVRVKFKAALGNAEDCEVTLDNAEPIGGTAKINILPGSFSLLGICHEGGTRLVNPNANIGIQNIAPIPGKDQFTVTAKVTEADTKIRLIALNGKVITEIDCPMNKEKAQDFTIDLSGIAAGIYFIEFKSATFSQMEKVMVGE